MIISRSLLPLSHSKHLLLSSLQVYLKKEGLTWVSPEELKDRYEFLPDIIIEIEQDKLPILFVDENVDLKDLFILTVMFTDFIKRYESDAFHLIPVMVFRKEPDEQRIEVIRKVEGLFNMPARIEMVVYNIDDEKELERFPNFLVHKVHFRYHAYYLKAKEKGWIE